MKHTALFTCRSRLLQLEGSFSPDTVKFLSHQLEIPTNMVRRRGDSATDALVTQAVAPHPDKLFAHSMCRRCSWGARLSTLRCSCRTWVVCASSLATSPL